MSLLAKTGRLSAIVKLLDQADQAAESVVSPQPASLDDELLECAKKLAPEHGEEHLREALAKSKKEFSVGSSQNKVRVLELFGWLRPKTKSSVVRAQKIESWSEAILPIGIVALFMVGTALLPWFFSLTLLSNSKIPHLLNNILCSLLLGALGLALGSLLSLFLMDLLDKWVQPRLEARFKKEQLEEHFCFPEVRAYALNVLKSPVPYFLQGDIAQIQRIARRLRHKKAHQKSREERDSWVKSLLINPP